MRNRMWRLVAVVGALALVAAACSDDDDSTSASGSSGGESAGATTTAPPAQQTVVEIAASNPDFSTLVSLVTKANLASTLSGNGPFTVFAPTNAAFAKVPPATLTAVGDDQATLQKVLTYHVVPGAVEAADVAQLPGVSSAQGAKVKTVEGTEITLKASGGSVTVTDALGNTVNVVRTDIVGSNGVIHVIDGVLLPVAPPA